MIQRKQRRKRTSKTQRILSLPQPQCNFPSIVNAYYWEYTKFDLVQGDARTPYMKSIFFNHPSVYYDAIASILDLPDDIISIILIYTPWECPVVPRFPSRLYAELKYVVSYYHLVYDEQRQSIRKAVKELKRFP